MILSFNGIRRLFIILENGFKIFVMSDLYQQSGFGWYFFTSDLSVN